MLNVNTNQSHDMRYHLTPVTMAMPKKKKKNTEDTSVGEDLKKLEPLHTVVENIIWVSEYGNPKKK